MICYRGKSFCADQDVCSVQQCKDRLSEGGATLTSRLAIGRESTETVLNRMRRLTASGLVRRVALPKDSRLKRPHEVAWGLTERGKLSAHNICWRHGWKS